MKQKPAPRKYEKTRLSPADQERIQELTGGSAKTLKAALDQWDEERAALLNFHDEMQALAIYVKRFNTLLDSIRILVAALESESALFLTPKMRAALDRYRTELTALDPALKEAKGIAKTH